VANIENAVQVELDGFLVVQHRDQDGVHLQHG
jgi:hypothetical protein